MVSSAKPVAVTEKSSKEGQEELNKASPTRHNPQGFQTYRACGLLKKYPVNYGNVIVLGYKVT